ncbi:hypothetical protein ABZ234_16705 [Nocardiopsis sp. NPDC006198]|uniref:hypothetical protein n=1 Tax=Nocardiopsis sp. NPDC006198 TaxID=3154472 RepID=UPI0033BC846C
MHEPGPPPPQGPRPPRQPGHQPHSGPQTPPGHRPPPGQPQGQGRPGPGQPPAQQAPPKKGSVGRTLAWVGCGCATVLLLVMAAAGFGGAYYFGWFGPEDVHASPPGPCDLLDTDAASEIAGNGENLEVYEADHSYAYGAEGLECVVTPGIEAASGHEVDLRTTVFTSQVNGIRKDNGIEAATSYFYDSRPESDGSESATCPDGRLPLSGTANGSGHALYRMDNLVVEVEVLPAGAEVEETLDEAGRTQAAVDLLCDAVSGME